MKVPKQKTNLYPDRNFPTKIGDKTYWISRSVATVTFVFKIIGDEIFALAQRRGIGAADNQGKLCVSCGYLEWGETLEECALREVKEECGFIGKENTLKLININSDPSEDYQNVSIHYLYFAEEDEDFDLRKAQGGEKDEVSEVKWLKVGNLKDGSIFQIDDKAIDSEQWAFGHDKRIKEYLGKFNE